MKKNAAYIAIASIPLLTLTLLSMGTAVQAGTAENEALFAAAQAGDLTEVVMLLERGADPNAVLRRSSSPRMAITVAIEGDHQDVVRQLVQAGLDLRDTTLGEQTPLTAASATGNTSIIRLLLAAGESADHGSFGDGTPLIMAAKKGHVEAVTLLLEAGADPDGVKRGDGSPLIAAAGRGNLDIVKLLIEQGADVNLAVKGDDTPLINAARHGHQDVVAYLVERGADVNQKGDWKLSGRRSPLNVAAEDAPEIRAVLLAAGAR